MNEVNHVDHDSGGVLTISRACFDCLGIVAFEGIGIAHERFQIIG